MADDPVPLSVSLTGVVRSLRGGAAGDPARSAQVLGGVFGRWTDAVGDAVAAHVQPVKLDGDRLVVEVDDPAWATQLKFLEATLRERLEQVAGARVSRFEIRVRR